MTVDDTSHSKEASAPEHARTPYRIHLPEFVTDETIGLGDAIRRITSSIGIRPCGGCERRAAILNRWFVVGRTR